MQRIHEYEVLNLSSFFDLLYVANFGVVLYMGVNCLSMYQFKFHYDIVLQYALNSITSI